MQVPTLAAPTFAMGACCGVTLVMGALVTRREATAARDTTACVTGARVTGTFDTATLATGALDTFPHAAPAPATLVRRANAAIGRTRHMSCSCSGSHIIALEGIKRNGLQLT